MKISKIFLFLIFIGVFTGTVLADTFIKQVTSTDGYQMMGQNVEPENDTITMWLGDGLSRSYAKDGSILMDGKKQMIYMIDDNRKAYSEMSFDIIGDMKKMMATEDMDEEEARMMEQQMQMMMAMMQITATVTPTEETKQIKGYNCKKYVVDFNIAMANIKSDYWVSKDIDVDYDAFKKLNLSKMLLMPGADKVIEEFSKIDGFLVFSEGSVNVMGTNVKTTSELLEIVKKNAPAGTFEIPKDYTKEPLKPMGDE